MGNRILLIGGGGHCKSVLDSLLELNYFEEIGIVDKKEMIGSSVLGVQVIACDEDLTKLFIAGFNYAFITIGSIGDPSLRIKLFNNIESIGFIIPNIIDSTAKVSRFADLEKGIFVGKHALINAGAKIERASIINSGAIIEHDCSIGEFVHIAPGAVLGGEVCIGRHTHIGSNSTIKQQLQVGFNVIIGMGSVVTHNIENNVIAYGIPCKKVKKLWVQ